jgi:hypothetical protein
MEISRLKSLVRKGEVEDAINQLTEFVSEYHARFAKDVYLLSARFQLVKNERISGRMPIGDYQIEFNSITNSLWEIIKTLEDLDLDSYKKKKNQSDVEKEIMELAERYDHSRKKAKTIQTTPTRLREKNEICKKLVDIFINYPDLLSRFSNTENEGIIAGIANRFKIIPDTTGIDIFERVVNKISGNFPKVCIVNALAEIVYSGQIRFGDELRIYGILDLLSEGAVGPLDKNIQRVRSELDYFLGKFHPPQPSERK